MLKEYSCYLVSMSWIITECLFQNVSIRSTKMHILFQKWGTRLIRNAEMPRKFEDDWQYKVHYLHYLITVMNWCREIIIIKNQYLSSSIVLPRFASRSDMIRHCRTIDACHALPRSYILSFKDLTSSLLNHVRLAKILQIFLTRILPRSWMINNESYTN